jgi:hypothetical protein
MSSARPLKTTKKQPGGVTGKGFLPGRSGNPGGRPRSERKLLERLYGEDGEKVYQRLELLRNHPATPVRLKAQIDFFIIERFHGRLPQSVNVDANFDPAAYLIALEAGQ